MRKYLHSKPLMAAALALGLFAGLALAEQVNRIPQIEFLPNGLYVGKYSASSGYTARAGTSNKILSSYSTGPSPSGNAFIYDFPSLSANTCQDSVAFTIDAGTPGATFVSFGDVVMLGMDQIPSSAHITFSAYVAGTNSVKVHECNDTGGSVDAPDASYYFRTLSNQN